MLISSPNLLYIAIPMGSDDKPRPWERKKFSKSSWIGGFTKYGNFPLKIEHQEDIFLDQALKLEDDEEHLLLPHFFPSSSIYNPLYWMLGYHGNLEVIKLSRPPYRRHYDGLIVGLRGHLEMGRVLMNDFCLDVLVGACIGGNIELVKECYEKSNERSALYYAAASGQLEVVKMLLQFKNINNNESFTIKEGEEHTALHGAAENGHLEVVRELIRGGANINACVVADSLSLNRPIPFNPLQRALLNNHHEVAMELINKGALIMSGNKKDTYTTLYYAASRGDVEVTKRTLKGKQYKEEDLNHVLCLAAFYNHLGVTRELIKALQSKNKKKRINNNEALNLAIEGGNANMVRLLLDQGCSVDECFDEERGERETMGINIRRGTISSIHSAVANDKVEVVEALLERGVNPNFTNKDYDLIFTSVASHFTNKNAPR